MAASSASNETASDAKNAVGGSHDDDAKRTVAAAAHSSSAAQNAKSDDEKDDLEAGVLSDSSVRGKEQQATSVAGGSGSGSDHKEKDQDKDNEQYDYNPGDRRFETRSLRKHWYQFWRYKYVAPAPPVRLDQAPPLPYAQANPLSVLTYQWVNPIMMLGYRRPLEATDLWKMDEKRSAQVLSKRLIADWERRVCQAELANAKISDGTAKVGVMRK